MNYNGLLISMAYNDHQYPTMEVFLPGVFVKHFTLREADADGELTASAVQGALQDIISQLERGLLC